MPRKRLSEPNLPDLDAEDPAAEDAARPSRSDQTRAANAISRLGLKLTRLSPQDLEHMALPQRLREEIELSQRLKPKSRGRQNRLIAQILRQEDHEAIEQRLNDLGRTRPDSVHHEGITQQWADRLVAEGAPAIEALIESYPAADRQRFRQWVRNATEGADEKKAKRARREILRAIRALRS